MCKAGFCADADVHKSDNAVSGREGGWAAQQVIPPEASHPQTCTGRTGWRQDAKNRKESPAEGQKRGRGGRGARRKKGVWGEGGRALGKRRGGGGGQKKIVAAAATTALFFQGDSR